MTKYNKIWEMTYPWVREHKPDNAYAYCTYCDSTVKITNGSIQLSRHANYVKHQTAAAKRTANPNLNQSTLVFNG